MSFCRVLFFTLVIFLVNSAFSQSQTAPSHPNREERKLGDIFLGWKIGSGMTNYLYKETYNSSDTQLTEKGMFFYNLSVTGEFFLASYASIIVDFGLEDIQFDRKTIWQNGADIVRSARPYNQWFNKITIASRFLFWNTFFIQTGPSVLIRYHSSALASFMGVSPNVNDSAGASFQWQFGLGASKIVGFQDNGDPLMSIDAGFFVYIPVAGNIVDNHSSTNAGGSPIHITENPYQFEFSIGFSFLV